VAILGAFLLYCYPESHLTYETVFKVINMYSLYTKLKYDLFSLFALVTLSKEAYTQLQSVA